MTDTLTSPSFPKGAKTYRSEKQARDERNQSMLDVIKREAGKTKK